jgi:hypothetical protein
VQDPLAQRGEPEMARLNHARVDRSHRYLDDAFTVEMVEPRLWPVDDRDGLARVEVLAQRIDAIGPIVVVDERPGIGMAFRYEPEQVMDFAFVPIGGWNLERAGWKDWIIGRDGRLDRLPATLGQSEGVDQAERAAD